MQQKKRVTIEVARQGLQFPSGWGLVGLHEAEKPTLIRPISILLFWGQNPTPQTPASGPLEINCRKSGKIIGVGSELFLFSHDAIRCLANAPNVLFDSCTLPCLHELAFPSCPFRASRHIPLSASAVLSPFNIQHSTGIQKSMGFISMYTCQAQRQERCRPRPTRPQTPPSKTGKRTVSLYRFPES